MNISKHEQRVLHELALGGEIQYVRADNGKVRSVECYTRDGFTLTAGAVEKLSGKTKAIPQFMQPHWWDTSGRE